MQMHDIISVGTATEDVFVGTREMKLISLRDMDDVTSYIAFEQGAKIPVSDIFMATGGGATNSAVAFARLGLDNGIICKTGADDAADRVVAKLQRENVDISGVVRSPDYTTGYSVILMCFTGDRTVLVHRGASTHLHEEDVDWDMLASAGWIYLSSMSGDSAPLFEKIAVHARDNDVKLAINPGSAQLRAGLSELAVAFQAADILFVNKSEAYCLAEVEPKRGRADEMEVLHTLHGAGADIVVMTDGSNGAEAYDGRAHYTVPAIDVAEKSTLGAGDAFASACTASLLRGMTLREALRAGTINAANIVRYLGAKRGLMTWEQLENALNTHPPQFPSHGG
jgi:ribokinase